VPIALQTKLALVLEALKFALTLVAEELSPSTHVLGCLSSSTTLLI
jgi:hypothetical protein